MQLEIERVTTEIDGLDDVLGGGIPRGHVVLVSGAPGTMKSTLAYAIMHNAARRGLRSLYISLEQSKASLERQMAAMGFDVTAAADRVHILDGGALQKDMGRGARLVWVDYLKRAVDNKRRIDGVDLVALDSLEALEVLAKFEDRRIALFEFFEWFRALDATALILAEATGDAPALVLDSGHRDHHDEEFLADGVLQLKLHPVSDLDVQRRLRVAKMRAANHRTGYYTLVFEDGRFSVTRSMSE